ncbi:MAG: hypothetical protein IJV03_02655 [Alphaproteobacteria bacterium]|nr:hypothetical protein [Alphaproteobacteria bacterium]
MHKYFVLSLIVSIIPNLCLAENPRITKLMREKQAKMEQLEKCMGSSKGLKIAGISTLGLTAVGVAGNIAEAKVIQDYNDRIESTDKNIEKTKIEIQEKRDALDAKEEAEAKRIAAEEQAKREGRILRKIALEDIARINNGGYNGDKAVSHGYVPEKLPENLRSQFANAMVNFISRCRSLIGNGIEDVSLSPTEQENWRQYLGGTPLAEDAVLDDLNEHIIAECKIIKCNEKTHTFVNDGYGVRCEAKSATSKETTTPGNETTPSDKKDPTDDESAPEDSTTPGDATTPADNSSTPENKTTPKKTTTPGDENTPTQPTVVADDTDCITEAKKKDSDAKTAKYKNGVCKITACNNPSKHPSDDGQKCVVNITDGTDCKASLNNPDVKEAKIQGGVCKIISCIDPNKEPKNGKSCVAKKTKKDKPITEWTNEEIKNNFSSYCDKALFTSGARQDLQMCCDATYQIGTATGWDWNNNKCLCKDKYEWKNNKCVKKENSKDLSNKVIYYTRMMNKAQTTNFEHDGSPVVVSAYDALDASGNKMNCPSTADGLSNCARVALEQKLKSLGYTNFKIVKY